MNGRPITEEADVSQLACDENGLPVATADLIAHEAAWIARLSDLGHAIRGRLRSAMLSDLDPSLPICEEECDTIYAIDRHVEPVIEASIDAWPDECKPLLLTAEGIGDGGVTRFGADHGDVKYHVILDPIDGTRELMYGKRSAWCLVGVSRSSLNESLGTVFAAAMVELPTAKQSVADYFVAGKNHPTKGFRLDERDGRPTRITVRPSTAETLKDGFAQVSNFFPGTKVLASELMERIVSRTLGPVHAGRASVFDDQYISTGGQLVELMMGHDRFCCDLRPLFYEILEHRSGDAVARGLECHPYDLAASLVARQAGILLTDGFGRPIEAPLNVRQGVHWCAFANRALQAQIQPVVSQWLVEHGVVPN